MNPMTPQKQSEARKMVSDSETQEIQTLAAEVAILIESRLALGLSGQQIGAIAAAVRTTLRSEIDAAIYHQRSTAYPGMPAV